MGRDTSSAERGSLFASGGRPIPLRPDLKTEIRWLRDALERTDVALREILSGRYVGDTEAVLASNAWLLFAGPDEGGERTSESVGAEREMTGGDCT